MWKSNKILLLFFLLPLIGKGQNCTISIHGRALDEITKAPLPFANIYLENGKIGVIADEEGYFAFDNLCADTTHIRISHVSCEPLRVFLAYKKDTVLTLFLHHHEELMDEILVHGKSTDQSIQNSGTLDKDVINQRSDQNLADAISEISGVSVLHTGAGISKPVIHGLYGNRIGLLNNGVAQAGQQWGNDHAPEIDVFSADHISVIKGVSSLAYAGNSLGGLVLIEPGEIGNDPHIHGTTNYIYETNGKGHTANLSLEKGGDSKSMRVTGTLKNTGDRNTPDYFLNNTGKREENASLQLELDKNKTWNKSFYFSSFNATIGILRGAHIGNLTDLAQSFKREIPFFTEEEFSREIEAPKQRVNHQLLKVSLRRKSGQQIIDADYSIQLNDRKEFDVRRSGRSDTPALSLRQLSQQTNLRFQKSFVNGSFLQSGLTGNYTDNTNQPETGILPLIPDYNQFDESAFIIFQKEDDKLLYEIGGRLNLSQLNVVTITRELPREIERFSHQFSNTSVSAGLKYNLNSAITLNANLGYVQRPPAINELYSFGLHQGVSSIEIGNNQLLKENSLKSTLSTDFKLKDKLFIQALFYTQFINDYIYLQPNPVPDLTIRGAFPVFEYNQTNARLLGLDALLSYEPIEKIRYIGKLSLLKGDDLSNGLPLVYMPSNNIQNDFSYSFSDFGVFNNTQVSMQWKTFFEQKNYVEGQDFVAPPPTYSLLSASVHTAINLHKNALHFSVKIDNLLDTAYRDYLNRQRYFSDELGRNISFRVNWEF